jgi:hypothetical protein
MSWLNDIQYDYLYKCAEHEFMVGGPAGEMPPTTACPQCGGEAQYMGFVPVELRQTTQVEFDQNGRKGMAIRGRDGSISYISKTKLHYMKTGKIENQYTPAYREHLEKTEQDQMLRTEHSRKRAKVTSAADMLKNMPDGEYLSDGTNVIAKENT